jgi:hypothetical protein
VLDPRASPPAGRDGEIAGPDVSRALAVERQRNPGREVRLADEQLPAPPDFDDDAVVV